MQIHAWPDTPGHIPALEWVDLARAIQNSVSSRQAGKPLTAFSTDGGGAMHSKFGDLETVVNWNPTETYPTDIGRIAPTGFLSFTDDRSLMAGVFVGEFAGNTLSPGMHGFVVERSANLVSVSHPFGPETTLSFDAPDGWAPGDPLTVSAVDRGNNLLGNLAPAMDGRRFEVSVSPVNGSRPSKLLIQGGGTFVPTDGAASLVGPVSPGEIISLYGSGIGPEREMSVRLDSEGRIATDLGGIRVLFDGVPAPLLFVSRNQVNAIVPYAVAKIDTSIVQFERDGVRGDSIQVPVVNAVPRIFTANSAGTGQAAALNQDGSANSEGNPAQPGSVVVLYGTGGGLERVLSADGDLASDASRTVLLEVAASVDGRPAEVLYAGAAPGFAGMLQVNIRLPADVSGGNSIPVSISAGKASSQASVTIAIQ